MENEIMHKFWNKTFCIDSRNFDSERDLILDIPAVLEMSKTLLIYICIHVYVYVYIQAQDREPKIF